MRLRPEARVGLIVFLALIAVLLIYWFFGELRFRGGSYVVTAEFDDVMRLSRQADVRLSGVRIGYVDSINLTPENKARVVMAINRRHESAIPEDSTARVTTGGLVGVGEYYVEIIPGSSSSSVRSGGSIRTVKLPNLDDVMVDAKDIISGLRTSVNSIKDIVSNPEMKEALTRILANVELTTERAAALTQDARLLLATKEPQIDTLLAGANSAMTDFMAVGQELRTALEGGSTEQIQAALQSARTAADNLEVATRRLRELAEDESISEDIRKTISNARQASEDAVALTSRFRGILSGRDRESTAAAVERVTGLGSRIDVLGGGKDHDLRVDYNFTIPGSNDEFYRIGLFNIGESTKLNLQAGKLMGDRSAFRYGLYASKLGIGYDRVLWDNLGLQLDLFRPNDPALEAKLRYDFSPNLGAVVGVDDLLDNGGLLVGLQYHK